jgi:hypothetical protein
MEDEDSGEKEEVQNRNRGVQRAVQEVYKLHMYFPIAKAQRYNRAVKALKQSVAYR